MQVPTPSAGEEVADGLRLRLSGEAASSSEGMK